MSKLMVYVNSICFNARNIDNIIYKCDLVEDAGFGTMASIKLSFRLLQYE